MCEKEKIETHSARERWLHGSSDEYPDRLCPNCDCPIDIERIEDPESNDGLLLCPRCRAELPWGAIDDVPTNDWFNWVCLEKTACKGTVIEGSCTVVRFKDR